MANVRGRRQFGGPKRRTKWEGAQIDLGNIAIGSPGFTVVIPETLLENDPNSTVVRVRGELMVSSDTASSSDSFGFCSVGIMLVDSKALAAGIASLQTPATDIGSDWLYWDVFNIGEAGASHTERSILSTNRHVVDSKAMRKVGSNQALVLVAEVVTCEGTTLANLCGELRVLLKLS